MLDRYRDERTLLSKLMIKLQRSLFWLVLVCVSLQSQDAYANDLTVIANASVSLNTLKLKDLRSTFTMKKRLWPDGRPISVFVLPNKHKTHKIFCRELLKVFPRQLESVWHRLVYSGTGERPILVDSVKEMMEQVASTPGAIGYIQSEIVNEDIKILSIK